MFNSNEKTLYDKYMAFNEVMLEEHAPLDVAAILAVQSLSFYKSVLSQTDYESMVTEIYTRRNEVPTFNNR